MRLSGPAASALRTAGWAGVAWSAFALTEAALLLVLPAARESALLLTPASKVAAWGVLAGLYLALGLGAGFVAGLAASWSRRGASGHWRAPDLAQLTLVAAFVAHLVSVRDLSRSVYLALAAALLIAAVLMARLRRPPTSAVAWSDVLAGPWGAALVLLAPLALRDSLHVTWLISRLGPLAAPLKVGVSAAATAGLVLLLAWLGRLASRRGWTSRRVLALQAGALPVAVTGLLALAWGSDARLLQRVRDEGPGAAGRPRATGVLIVTMDSVRADHLSAMGYRHDTTPGLRRLLSHATLFTRAVAASDMSLGTHASLFTGIYPGRHGAYEAPGYPAGRPLGAAHRTLAERLSAAGFASFGAAANGYFLNAAYGLTRGFTIFDVRPNDRLEMQSRVRRVAGLLPGGRFTVHRRARELNEVLLAGIDQARAGGRPFFAFANYMEAHAPYTADARFRGAFPGYDPSARVEGTAFLGGASRTVFDARQRAHLVSQYDAAIATLDHRLSQLFDALRARDLYDGLLLVVLADHGEMLGEAGTFGHGTGLIEDLLHVPLIVKFPWQKHGRVVDARASQVDIVPTVLDVLGLGPDARLDGRSLAAAPDPARVVMAEAPPKRAVYLGPFKLVEDGRGARLLFDVEADRQEARDLSQVSDARVQQAVRALESQIAAPAGSRLPAVDAAVLDRLRSLGYVR